MTSFRGFWVDVGNVAVTETGSTGVRVQNNPEIVFIARNGNRMYYIQPALSMDDDRKSAAVLRSLMAVGDFFKKVVISKSCGKSWTDNAGIFRLGLIDFLTDEQSLDR